jgi:hypothetical protein
VATATQQRFAQSWHASDVSAGQQCLTLLFLVVSSLLFLVVFLLPIILLLWCVL